MSRSCPKSPPNVCWSWFLPKHQGVFDPWIFIGTSVEVILTFEDCKPVDSIQELNFENATTVFSAIHDGIVGTTTGWHTYHHVNYHWIVIPTAGTSLSLPKRQILTSFGLLPLDKFCIPLRLQQRKAEHGAATNP